MSFNVRVPVDPPPNDWPSRRPRVARVVLDHAPDFVGVQEAMVWQASEMAADLPDYTHFGRGREADEGGEGTPIFYRHDRWELDPEDNGTFQISPTPEVPGSNGWGFSYLRICTWGRFIEKSSGRAVYVFNTHYPLDAFHRDQTSSLVAQRIAGRKHPVDPVLLTGDFNACEDEPSIEYLLGNGGSPVTLSDSFRELYPDAVGNVGTYHDFNGGDWGCKIDYVFVAGHRLVREAEHIKWNQDGLYPSDHFPVTGAVTF
jgi:endonuclease/exonuclease/phosphatase family metal-dependent hydrolase